MGKIDDKSGQLLTSLEESRVEERLFHELKSVMEEEVAEMSHVATRFFAKDSDLFCRCTHFGAVYGG
jgi:hypothetical protein